jgi:hypothetical protein
MHINILIVSKKIGLAPTSFLSKNEAKTTFNNL